MDALLRTDFKNMMQEAVNVDLRNNMIKAVEAKRNAVIIDFERIKLSDGEGVKRIVTIECKDDEFYEEMKKYAQELVRVQPYG